MFHMNKKRGRETRRFETTKSMMQCYKRRKHSKKDTISSLPDDVITNILSRLQINSVVATSVLSQRWRRLWTGVTAFTFDSDGHYVSEQTSDKFSGVVVDIVRQLTSQTLRVFKLQLSSLSDLRNPSVAHSCFREICSRNVEEIIIEEKPGNRDCFTIPGFLFSSNHLVVLTLKGNIQLDLTEIAEIQLPNLKQISLNYLINSPQILGSLFSSCQRLIDAELIFRDYTTQPEPQIFLDISAPNLISLQLEMSPDKHTQRPNILIDAPKLETLDVSSFISDSYSIKNPMKLVKASIYTFWNPGYSHVTAEEQVGFLRDVFEFVRRMSSVTELNLWVDDDELDNVYRYLNSVNPELMITFPNLERLETNLNYIGWKDLVLSMKCFPNLRHLKVFLDEDSNLVLDPADWCVPECLTKMKTIEISGVKATEDELVLLGYILSNAFVLEKLEIELGQFGFNMSKKEAQLWNVCKNCVPLFELPRASSACEVVFKLCGLFRASSNDWDKGNFICEISSLFDMSKLKLLISQSMDFDF